MNRQLTLILVLLVSALPSGVGRAAEVPCKDQGTRVIVDTRLDRLWLCEQDVSAGDYRIAIGKGGTGKRTQGDNKTPLGDYSLEPPRPSGDFSVFIPVGYPTLEQAKAGFTGGDIGIHGPHRKYAWLGNLTTMIDWTRGCIAVGTVSSIEKIAGWVKAHPLAKIRIR